MAYKRKSRLKKINKNAPISKRFFSGGREQSFFEPKGCCTKYFSSVLGVTRHLLFCCLLRTFWNDVLIIKKQSVVTRVHILVDFMLTFVGIK